MNAERWVSEWFAAQVFAGREAFAATHLRARGYDVLLPLYQEHRRWSDRIKKVERALFEGYVFCRAEQAPLGAVVTAPGVLRLVGNKDGPLPIPAHEIEAIQRIAQSQLMAEPWQFVKVGQQVRVSEGPLRDTVGIVVRVKSRDRLIVSISVLQRAVAVEIDCAWLTVPIQALMA